MPVAVQEMEVFVDRLVEVADVVVVVDAAAAECVPAKQSVLKGSEDYFGLPIRSHLAIRQVAAGEV